MYNTLWLLNVLLSCSNQNSIVLAQKTDVAQWNRIERTEINPSDQIRSFAQSCPTLRPHESQHARPPCPSPTPRIYSNSCPLSRWCHPTMSSSVVPFFSCLQSFPVSGFSDESVLCIRWSKYWSFLFSISPSNEYSRLISFQFSSANQLCLTFSTSVSQLNQSCLTLCDPMDCSTPGLPVHHQLPEFTQTHVHWVGDAIQPSHPLSSPSSPAFNLSQHQGLFQWVSSFHQVAKVLEYQLQHQSFQLIFRIDFLSYD